MWCSNIRRKNGIRERAETGRETYLAERCPGALDGMFVISKECARIGGNEEGSYYNYTAFSNYPEIYKYVASLHPRDRRLHEVVSENRPQKPRFDVDIDWDKYQLALKLDDYSDTLPEMGERVKDLVISSVVAIMELKGYKIELEKDVMVFTSHGTDSKGHEKRSYHILLNRYFHHNSGQAKAFYLECAKVSADSELFELLVDGSIYRAGGSLRMMWSSKVGNVERVKRYTPQYTYQGVVYNHSIDMVVDEEADLTPELQQMFILANSLVTFVDDASPMPVFAVKTAWREENECLTEEVYEECKKMIKAWDINGVYEVTGTEDGKVNLHRLKPDYCCLCDRIHEAMDTFCYLGQAQLFWHCGHAEGKGSVKIGRVRTLRTGVEAFVEGIFRGTGAVITFEDEDGEVIRTSAAPVEYGPPVIEVAGQTTTTTQPRRKLGELSGYKARPAVAPSAEVPSITPLPIPHSAIIPVVPPATLSAYPSTPHRQEEVTKKIEVVVTPELLEVIPTFTEAAPVVPVADPAVPVAAPIVSKPKKIMIKDPIKSYRITKKWTDNAPKQMTDVSTIVTKKHCLRNKQPLPTIVFSKK
jgi:hypothetical protein